MILFWQHLLVLFGTFAYACDKLCPAGGQLGSYLDQAGWSVWPGAEELDAISKTW